MDKIIVFLLPETQYCTQSEKFQDTMRNVTKLFQMLPESLYLPYTRLSLTFSGINK